MKSVNQQIAYLINQDISLQKCLHRQIINIRGLAQHLKQEHLLPHSLDAIISAIRRYDIETMSLLRLKETQKAFAGMSISTKDNIAIIVLRDRSFKVICKDFLSENKLKDNARIVKSKEIIQLIVSQKDLDKKLALFSKENILDIRKDLSEIRLQFPRDAGKVKGVIARISSELTLHNINVENVIYSVPDVLLYVQEKSLVDAHRSLMEIKTERSKKN